MSFSRAARPHRRPCMAVTLLHLPATSRRSDTIRWLSSLPPLSLSFPLSPLALSYNMVFFYNGSASLGCLSFVIAVCCLVAKSCPTFCDPTDCRAPGFPVPHHLLESAQTHHWVEDANATVSSSVVSSPSAPLLHLPLLISFFLHFCDIVTWYNLVVRRHDNKYQEL